MEAGLFFRVQKSISLSCHTCVSSSSTAQILTAQLRSQHPPLSLLYISIATTSWIYCPCFSQNRNDHVRSCCRYTRSFTERGEEKPNCRQNAFDVKVPSIHPRSPSDKPGAQTASDWLLHDCKIHPRVFLPQIKKRPDCCRSQQCPSALNQLIVASFDITSIT